MIEIIALLEVKDKVCFKKFESQAIKIMKKYNGKLVSAFRPNEEESTLSNIYEVHYLEFPDLNAFNSYKSDPQHKELKELRNNGISKTSVIVSGEKVVYEGENT